MGNFKQLYSEALAKKADLLESEVCPTLKTTLSTISLAYKSYYAILLNKHIIRADEYGDSWEIKEIKAPSSETFLEATITGQLSARLTDLDNQFDYLGNIVTINLKTLSIKMLKNITEVLRYIEWHNVTTMNEQFITRNFASLVQPVKNDKMMNPLMVNLTSQLSSHTRTALALVKELSSYFYEDYKYKLIISCFPSISFNTGVEPKKAIEQFIGELRLSVSNAKLPFYRELATQTVTMVYGKEAEVLQQKALEVLAMAVPKAEVKTATAPKKPKPIINYKEPLFTGFFEISRCESTFISILDKLSHNHRIHQKYGKSLSARFLEFVQKFVLGQRGNNYKTSYTDQVTGKTTKEEINFDEFVEQLEERIQTFRRFADSKSPIYKKMNELDPEEIRDLLIKQISDTRNLLTLCVALDDFFKNHLLDGFKERPKNINIEITSLRRQLSKVQEYRHEYEALVAKGPQLEQKS